MSRKLCSKYGPAHKANSDVRMRKRNGTGWDKNWAWNGIVITDYWARNHHNMSQPTRSTVRHSNLNLFVSFHRSCIVLDSLRQREREIRVFDSKHHDDDEFMCAVCTRLSGSWFLFDDWSWNFCLYCLHPLLCCFLPQRQGSVLIPFQGIY